MIDTDREVILKRLIDALVVADCVADPAELGDTEEEFWRFMVGKAVMPVVDELTAALDRVRAWATSMEKDFQGNPSLYGAAIATEVRNRIAGDVAS